MEIQLRLMAIMQILAQIGLKHPILTVIQHIRMDMILTVITGIKLFKIMATVRLIQELILKGIAFIKLVTIIWTVPELAINKTH